jgi:hypothetical protein
MSIKDTYNLAASAHENNGGSCITIQIGGVDVKACVDENGKIIDDNLRKYVSATGQLPSDPYQPLTWDDL